MKEQAPIIIIKKKGGHGGHHGGAWKVAYADFVTAMMALFIVLWLLSSSDQVKKAVGGYFQDPTGNGKLMGSTMAGSGENLTINKEDMPALKEKIEQALKQMPKFQEIKDNVKLIVTTEGLRIELLESEKGMFFESGNHTPTAKGMELIEHLGAELSKLDNKLLIEGHTDAKPFSAKGTYTNWELSADRANTARRLMEAQGLGENRVAQVRGFADQNLLNKEDPEAANNRRVSVIVMYNTPPKGAAPPEGGKPSPAGEGGHGAPAGGGEHGAPAAAAPAAAPAGGGHH